MAVFGRVSGTGKCVAWPLRCRTATERGNGDILRGVFVIALLEERSAEGGSASAGRRRGPRKGMSVCVCTYVDLETLGLSSPRPRQSVRLSGPSTAWICRARSLAEPRSGFTNSLVSIHRRYGSR